MKQRWIFLRRYLRSPRQVGSVTPSSDALIDKMMEPIDWKAASTLVELGAGTGAVTGVIEQKRRADATLVSFEIDDVMRSRLYDRFPEAIFHKDAVDLSTVLKTSGVGPVDCVVSGLPLSNFPDAIRTRLMEDVHAALKPGGKFVAFQYSMQMKKILASVFAHVSVKLVLRNVPPAFVYVCEKAGGPSAS